MSSKLSSQSLKKMCFTHSVVVVIIISSSSRFFVSECQLSPLTETFGFLLLFFSVKFVWLVLHWKTNTDVCKIKHKGCRSHQLGWIFFSIDWYFRFPFTARVYELCVNTASRKLSTSVKTRVSTHTHTALPRLLNLPFSLHPYVCSKYGGKEDWGKARIRRVRDI